MAMCPKISVIVPMYNASKTIGDCLSSILDSDYPDFEVIVVDDASKDDSVSKISSLSCRLVKLDENLGPGCARNKGAEAASGEIIAFTDADCRIPRYWLKNIVKAFSKNDIGAITGGYSKSDNNGFMALFQFYDTYFRQRNIPEFLDTCITSNFACRKEIFLELGGFPQQRINEDMEFGIALSRRCRILWNKDNGVSHYFNNNLRHYFFEQILWSESVVKAYLSNPSAMVKKNTYSNAEIFTHLLLTGLLYLSLLSLFWNSFGVIIFICVTALYFIINIKFIRFIAMSKGYAFSFKMMPFLLLRNTAWIFGILKVFFKHLWRILQRLMPLDKKGRE